MTSIRLATHDDCKTCTEMSRIPELVTPTDEYLPEEYFHDFVDEDEMFFVAEEDNKILGYALGEPLKSGVAFLGLLTVHESARGKGVGKKLLNHFEKTCREKDFEVIIFYAPTFNKNTLTFYNKQGFTQGKNYAAFLKVLE